VTICVIKLSDKSLQLLREQMEINIRLISSSIFNYHVVNKDHDLFDAILVNEDALGNYLNQVVTFEAVLSNLLKKEIFVSLKKEIFDSLKKEIFDSFKS
jgi:hypothetical protein